MNTNAMPQTELTPPPPPLTLDSTKPNGPTETGIIASVSAPDHELMKQLRTLQQHDQQMRNLGIQHKETEQKIAKQETVVATVKAKLDEERATLNALEKEKEELSDDLAKLAAGGFIERLPLGKSNPKPAPVGTAAQAIKEGLENAAAERDAWKLVRLASLEPTIDAAKIAILFKHSPSIVTLGDLAAYRVSEGENWWKNFKKLGKAGMQQIMAAVEAYEKQNPNAAPKPPEKLMARPATEAELIAGEFIPETAAHLLVLLGPPLTPPVTADDLLTTPDAFRRQWAACEANAPGTKNAAKSAFNAEGWANLQKAAAVMKKFHGEDADTNVVQTSSLETIVNEQPEIFIQVGQRDSGQWAFNARASYGEKKFNGEWIGNFPGKSEAVIAAADAIDDFLPRSAAMLPTAQRNQVKKIKSAMDRIDKQLTKDTGKSIDEIRGLTEKPVETIPGPTEANGKPKRFKGNPNANK